MSIKTFNLGHFLGDENSRFISSGELESTIFFTPNKLSHGPLKFGEWYKDFSSGRSFNISNIGEDGRPVTFTSKSGDIYYGTNYRRFNINDGVVAGVDFYSELFHESYITSKVQERAIELLGRETFMPIPIQISKLDNFFDEKGNIIDFGRYIEEVLKFPEYVENFLGMFYKYGIIRDVGLLKELHLNPKKIKEFILSNPEIVFGNLSYFLNGLNTRIVESRKIGLVNFQSVLEYEYPEAKNEIDTLKEFMRRIGETLGVIYDSGFSYKRKSSCVLIDTTIGGNTMDNGHLGEGIELEEVRNRLNELYSVCIYFGGLLGIEKEIIKNLFKDIFLQKVCEFVKDENLRKFIQEFNFREIKLNKSFYMVNNPSSITKIIKDLTILVVNGEIKYFPGFKGFYFING